MLAPPRWRRIASWTCGWAYLVGNITITLAVNFGTALFFVSCVNVFSDDVDNPVLEGSPYQVYLIFLGITLLCNAVSALGNKWLPWLDVSPSRSGGVLRTPQRETRGALIGNMIIDTYIDRGYFLDFCCRHCHHGLRSRHCCGRSPQC